MSDQGCNNQSIKQVRGLLSQQFTKGRWCGSAVGTTGRVPCFQIQIQTQIQQTKSGPGTMQRVGWIQIQCTHPMTVCTNPWYVS